MTTLARCCVCSFIIFTYWCSTISAQLVDIPDPNLKQAIREKLVLPDEIPITQQEMLQLTGLDAKNRQINNLTGLEYATNLTWLDLSGNNISNLKSLAKLIQLERLWLYVNPISDISPIANLTQLRGLQLGDCNISDITPLARLTQLEGLWLYLNPISDISPIANLTQLETIHLGACQISDITPLTNLTRLVVLTLNHNQIEIITPLADLIKLTELSLTSNRIVDIGPLANLTMLEELRIDSNAIADVSPLANLENLMDLKLAGNVIRDFSPLFGLDLKNVDIDIHMLQELASVEVEIPDPNLERVIREKLALPDRILLTQADMLQLGNLDASNRQIKDLTGLEYAIHLTVLYLSQNEISDLTPLAGLSRLESLSLWDNPISDLSPLANLTELNYLHLGLCQISDISPLANLTNLTNLYLHGNQISDIKTLTGLTRLTHLWLGWNQIVDVRPLSNLTKLTELILSSNRIVDFSPLEGLSLTRFEYDEVCELTEVPGPPVQERIQNRSFPSVFQAWYDILNRPELSRENRVARHDLYLGSWFGLHWLETDQGFQLVGNLDRARQERDTLLALNPNLIFIVGILMRDDWPSKHPEDWPHWIRDATGNRVSATDYSAFLMDFTHPDVQDIIVQQAIAVSKCGLYDGIFLDWWREDWIVLKGYRTYEEEQRARDVIIQQVRAAVGDDFLIWVNPNRSKPRSAMPYINGLFMETVRYDDYALDGLIEIESTLLWAEENLREPRINGLEGWGVETEAPDSPTNLRWMRVFTTMGLTHSDGYVLYITGIRSPNHEHDWSTFEPTHLQAHNRSITHNHGHDHYWYDFWDAGLGKPIGPKAQQYQNIDGLFIREFTNGWAVYNRSGKSQQISLAEAVIGVESGQTGTAHQLADLDGEIYLRAGTRPAPTDINGDGVVNILDLILVAQNFGTTKSDINGDGTTNILDLILVAQHLGETSIPAAPAALPVSLSPETVQGWIDMAHAQNDGSAAFVQGIAMLERLLALMIPEKTVLRANYPNPFNPETWIPYHLASDTEVRINIYDIQGALVRQFDIGHQKAGYYTDRTRAAHWDGRNEIGEPVASGVYFYTLTTNDYTGTRRMAIIK